MNQAPNLANGSRAAADCLALSEVCYRADGHDILKNVTLTIDHDRIGIVGRNGSGKSTLARIVAGLVAPSSGTALVHGKNLARDRRAALNEVGIIFQNPDHQIIFPTVVEEIAFGLAQQGRSKPDAENMARAVLDRFSKAHWADAGTSSLSQGQKHLVCLMSVVAMAPRLLILDEPFAGLDLAMRMQLHRYLRHYSGTLLHISHDPSDLAGYRHLIWLDKGTVRAQGPGADILAAYQEEMQKLGEQDDISDLSD